MANIKISELPLKVGSAGISTGYLPISIGNITYKLNPGQLNLFSLNPNSVVITDGGGQLASSVISSTELFALKDISGNVQTQINNVVASLTAYSKTYVTGGTHNTSAGTSTFTNTTGGTFQVTGYVKFDTYTTGGTFTPSAGTATFTNNTGGTFNVTGFTTGFTFTPENVANKQNSYDFDGSAQKYPTVDGANAALRNVLKVAARTGLLHKTDNFNMTVLNNTTIRILSADTVYFQFQGLTQPAPGMAIKTFPQKDYPLTQLISGTSGNTNVVPLSADGVYIRYLGYDFSGNVISQPNNFNDNDNIFQMGYCAVVKSGSNVNFLGGTGATARNIFVKPDMACNTEFDRISTNTTTVTIAGNAAASFKTLQGNAFGISLNYKSATNPNNTSSIDTFVVTGFTGNTPFVSIDPNFATATTSALTVHTLWTELESGIAINNSFFNTTTKLRDTLNNGSATVKRVLMGFRGGLFVQEGEHAASTAYADLTTARLNIFTQPFSDAITPGDVVIEVARIAMIKGASDFTNTTQIYIVNTASSDGGASGGFAPVGDASVSNKGIIQLAGDLSGTATAPTVPALATKISGAGSGISGYTAKWNSTSGLTTSNVFDTGTNIGIGTTGATYRLQVEPAVVTGGSAHNLLKLGVASTTVGTKARLTMIVNNNPNTDGNSGAAIIDAERTANNIDLAFAVNDVPFSPPIERMRLYGNGTLGVNTLSQSGPFSKFHVFGDATITDKITYGNGLLTTNNLAFTKHLGQFTFTAGTANQNIDIILGNNDLKGHIEVTLSSDFQGGNAYGSIVKNIHIGATPNNNITQNQGNVIVASSATTGHFSIGDVYWDSFNSRYAIRIAHLSSALNNVSVSVKYFNASTIPNASTIFSALTLSPQYIQSGATKNYVTFSDKIYVNNAVNDVTLINDIPTSNIAVGSVAQLVTSASTNNLGFGKNLNFAPNCSNGILIGNGSALFSQDTILIGSGLANIQAFTTRIGHATTTDTYLGGMVHGTGFTVGGSASQFLKADGSLDSTIYDTNSRTVRNQSGITLSAGTIVEINSITGGIPNVSKANANAFINGQLLIINQTIANNATGIAVQGGTFTADTSTFSPNDTLYVGLNGGFQNNIAGLTAVITIGKVVTSALSGIVALDTNAFTNYSQAYNFDVATAHNDFFADLDMQNHHIINVNTLSGASATFRPTDTTGAVTIRNNRASNASKIQEWKNITGGTTASMDGNGLFLMQRLVAQTSTNDALVGFSSGGSALVAIGSQLGAAAAVVQHTTGGDLAVFDNISGGTVTIDSGATITATNDAYFNGLTVGRGGGNNAFNTAFGLNALSANTTGQANTAIGRFALNAETTAFGNVAVGHQAMQFTTTGGSNTSIGTNSMGNNIIGGSNVAIGNTALFQNLGNENVGVGTSALANLPNGSGNTAIGTAALLGLQGTQILNTAIGYNAGRFVVNSGSTQNGSINNSIFIGANSRGTSGTTNAIVIGNDALGLGPNNTVIGTTATTASTIYGLVTTNGFKTFTGTSSDALMGDGSTQILEKGSFAGGITVSPSTGTTVTTANNAVFTKIGDIVTANLGFFFSCTATTATTYTFTIPLPIARASSTQRFVGQATFEGGLTRNSSVLNSTATNNATINFVKTINGTETVLVNVTYQYSVLI